MHYNHLDTYNMVLEEATTFQVSLYVKDQGSPIVVTTYPIGIYDSFMNDLDQLYDIGFLEVWNKLSKTLTRVSAAQFARCDVEFR